MITPLLIDNRGLLKFGFSLTFIAIFIFAGGFFVGAQRATTIHNATDYTQILTLPQQVVVSENSLSSQPPEKIQAGEEIDVDEPDPASSISNKQVHVAVKKVEKKQKPMTLPIKPSSANSTDVSERKKPHKTMPVNEHTAVVLTKAISRVSGASEVTKGSSASITDDIVTSSLTMAVNTKQQSNTKPGNTKPDNAKLGKIKYSVQVGVYGRLYNARNTVKTLKAQQFDAYISDYRNKKNEIRYNVRFGYFTDRKYARQRLKKFKDDQVGDGYLVRFSAENIVSDVDTVASVQTTVLQTEEKKPVSSVVSSSEPGRHDSTLSNSLDDTAAKNSEGNISQAETFASDALTKSVIKTN
jgi:cell division septation protein DedD